MPLRCATTVLTAIFATTTLAADPDFARPREHARHFQTAVAASHRVLQVWLTHADPKTLLLPDRVDVPRRQWI